MYLSIYLFIYLFVRSHWNPLHHSLPRDTFIQRELSIYIISFWPLFSFSLSPLLLISFNLLYLTLSLSLPSLPAFPALNIPHESFLNATNDQGPMLQLKIRIQDIQEVYKKIYVIGGREKDCIIARNWSDVR